VPKLLGETKSRKRLSRKEIQKGNVQECVPNVEAVEVSFNSFESRTSGRTRCSAMCCAGRSARSEVEQANPSLIFVLIAKGGLSQKVFLPRDLVQGFPAHDLRGLDSRVLESKLHARGTPE
jgi:hypothetical protein